MCLCLQKFLALRHLTRPRLRGARFASILGNAVLFRLFRVVVLGRADLLGAVACGPDEGGVGAFDSLPPAAQVSATNGWV